MKWSILILSAVMTASVAVHADPNSDLFKAASDGDLAGVRQALDQGAHVNSLDDKGRSAVLIAVMSSHPRVLKYLLEKGGNPNVRMHSTYREQFPSSDTDRNGADKAGVVRLLLKAGANRAAAAKFPLIVERSRNPSQSSAAVASRHMTPLMIASIRGDVDCASLLIAAGAEVNARSVDGHTPLMFAVLSYPFNPGMNRLGATVADLVAPDSPVADLVRSEK